MAAFEFNQYLIIVFELMLKKENNSIKKIFLMH